MYKFLDVSSYQPDIDYAAVAKQVQGVILRCGVTYWGKQETAADKCFEKHYAGFKRAGVPVGAYYYSAADSVGVALREADFVLELLKGKQFELPIYFDVECEARMANLSKDKLTEICEAFCDKLERNGYFVGIYSYTYFFQDNLHHNRLAKKYTLWLADYRGENANQTLYRDIWQYTDKGRVDGIKGNVDLNWSTREFTATIKEAGLNGWAAEEKKSVATLVGEVLAGKWGDGAERRKQLEAKGYSYDEVQNAVNDALLTMIAKEVLRGTFDNGAERRRQLEAKGYNYEKVQQRVNELLNKL